LPLVGAGAVALVVRKYWKQFWMAGVVANYCIQIALLDVLPESVRRSILSKEYSGENLEKRLKQKIFKGASTARALWRMSSINRDVRVRIGDAVPDTRVLHNGQEIALASLMRSERPLLLNFGSCTWPPFLSQLSKFIDLQRELSHAVDFAFVYLEEAHPTDGWMYDSVTHFLPQHTSIQARVAASELLAGEVRARDPSGAALAAIPLVVDTLSNSASIAYGALPERLVVLQQGRIQWVGGKGPEEYSIEDARDVLLRLIGRQ
jgi:thyroxine 5-deiodinase